MEKVILITDRNASGILLQRFLSRKYLVISAENNEEAVFFLNNGIIPDIIISDYNKSCKEEQDILTGYMSDLGFINIPVVVTSKVRSKEIMSELRDKGVLDCILKPFKLSELDSRIESILSKTVEAGKDEKSC
jgi:response regulator RpfG family c-di-GMP phosphodiesterase